MLKGLSQPLSWYVTRKTASGYVYEFHMSAWMLILAQFLVFLNIIAWGILGLYFAARVIV